MISTDFAPEMVAAARRESERLGLANVDHREMDAERMDLADSSVDGVLCRWGYMLMADPAAALAETRRVLRDGGRVSLSVWGAAERNPWASVPAKALTEHTGAPAPKRNDPGIFAMADPDRVTSLLRDAGFGEPHLEEIEVSWRFESFADYWRYITELAGGIAMALQAMPETDREAVRKLVERATGDYPSMAAWSCRAWRSTRRRGKHRCREPQALPRTDASPDSGPAQAPPFTSVRQASAVARPMRSTSAERRRTAGRLACSAT